MTLEDQNSQFDKMIKLALYQANKNAVEAPRAVSMRDGLSGMVIGRVATYIDMEVVKQLHIDKGLIAKVHTLDQNTAAIVDGEEAFEKTLMQEPESAVILFAFDENYMAQYLTATDEPGLDCCVV